MTKKRKLVKVEGVSSAYKNTYAKIGFSLTSSPKTGRKQCFPFVSCKDHLHDAVKSNIHKSNTYYGLKADVDTAKLRLLMTKTFSPPNSDGQILAWKKKLFAGKAILNFYEKKAGWKPSTITTVNHSIDDNVWLMTGPKEWMSSPHLLSMVALIMRVSIKENKPITFRNEKELVSEWERISRSNEGDCRYIKNCHRYFPMLMKEYNRLFIDDIKTAYNKSHSLFHTAGGIDSLCVGNNTPAGDLRKRFDEMKKKYKK